jgi:ACS family glucarate transporter-like MFS transporter/ACS family D-galactonate transporter-like MFS transporter
MHPANGRGTHKRYVVLVLLCLAATIAYLSRSAIAVPAELIRKELGLSLQEMGWIMSAFFWSYALGQLPSGWLGHVWGARRALAFYAVLWSVTTACTGWAVGFWSLIAARLGFGFAQAGVFPCSADTISKWLSKSQRGFATGALAAFMSVGGALGVALAGALLEGMRIGDFQIPRLSWRMMFVVFALPGVVWAVCFYVWFRDRPEEHNSVDAAELNLIRADAVADAPSKEPLHTPWRSMAADLSMWMICSQQFFRAAGYSFYATWFPTYLQKARGLTLASSGLLGSLPLVAVVVGSLLGGLVVDWVWKRTGSPRLSRQGVAMTAMLGCALCTLAAYYATNTNLAVSVLCVANLFAALGGASSYTVTIDKAGQYVAPIFGVMNMSGNFGAALCPIVVGQMFQSGLFNPVLVLVAGIYLSAAICWALANPVGSFGKAKSSSSSPAAP